MTHEIADILTKIYTTTNTQTFSEALLQINSIDNGRLFYSLIHYTLYYLISPDSFNNPTTNNKLIDEEDQIEYTANTDYSKLFLAKRYLSKVALENDNNVATYVDKELDKTPYDMYKKLYLPKKKKYTDSDFQEYVLQNLIAKHGITDPVIAEKVAKTLIAGKKLVEEHDIAVLEEIPRLKHDVQEQTLNEAQKREIKIEAQIKTKYSFYERFNNGWILRENFSIDDPQKVIRMFSNTRSTTIKEQPPIDKTEIIHSIGVVYILVKISAISWVISRSGFFK
jgi:hypothetical protein